jgi:O-antigen ligase
MKRIPFIFLLVFVFTIPWSDIFLISSIGTMNKFIGIILVVIAILYIVINKNLKELPILIWVMVLYLIFVLLSYIWSINTVATLGRFITGIQLLSMVWLIWQLCNNEKDKLLLLYSFIVGQYVSIIYMLYLFLSDKLITYRISLENYDPNNLATTLAIGIPIALYLFYKSRNIVIELIMFAYTPLAVYCIILTASRGGMIASFVGLLAIPLYFTIFNTQKKVIFLISSLIIITIVLYKSDSLLINLERNIERLKATTEMVQEGRLSGRERIWKTGLMIFKENTIIGVGAGGFRHAVEPYLYRRWAPHNTYLSLLVDIGIIGFLLFFTCFLVGVAPTRMLDYKIKILNTMLMMVLLVGMFNLGWEYHRITWLVLAILTFYGHYIYRDGTIKIVRG